MNYELINNIIDYLKNTLKFERYNHSISVSVTAVNIATKYGFNEENYLLAGLLHDIAKVYTNDELMELVQKYNIKLEEDDISCKQVLHSYVGAYISKEKFNINDSVFDAIYTHTMGDINMSDIQKIIYISDYTEPLRQNIENHNYYLKLAYTDLNKCVYEITKNTINYLKVKNKYIHKKTYEVFNYYSQFGDKNG